jgi:ATP-dependent Clp protease protease subunit
MHPQLIKLLALNKGKGFFKAESTGADEATLYVYDTIVSDDYWGGVSALSFAKALSAMTAPVIHLRINSPGGDVFAARAMAQTMAEHSSKIIAHIDGYAASAATFLAIAADESVISSGGMFMIHNAWTIAAGNAKDFIDMASLLSRTDQSIANDYVTKTGKTNDEITAWMDAETYFYGQEAVDAGFVDALSATAPKNKIHWDLSAYAKTPINKKPEPEDQPDPEEDPDLSFDLIAHNKNRLRLQQSA